MLMSTIKRNYFHLRAFTGSFVLVPEIIVHTFEVTKMVTLKKMLQMFFSVFIIFLISFKMYL